MICSQPRVVIFAPYKTGSTALFHAVRESWPGREPDLYFEPESLPELSGCASGGALAKVILGAHGRTPWETVQQVSGVTHPVVLVRDPRDWVISGMLFVIRERPEIYRDADRMNHFLRLLHEKETSPDQVPMIPILRYVTGFDHLEWIGELLSGYLDAESRMSGHQVFPYEFLVRQEFDSLNRFLGFSVSSPENLPAAHAHVPRSRTFGDWRNWFLEEDLDVLLPLLYPYLTHYGYDPDESPAEKPAILPEHSSEYVKRILKDRCPVD